MDPDAFERPASPPGPMTRPGPIHGDPDRRPRVGVLALQGAVREHVNALRETGAEAVEVRLPKDLVGLDALILPGGESTTQRRLMDRYGLTEPITAMARAGAPVLGTCAGMILLAERLSQGEAPMLGLLDVEVRRNAYGRQLSSFEADLQIPSLGEEPLHGVFIRAPVVADVGPAVEVLARDPDGNPVAVRQGRVIATAFHPELTPDRRLHRLLIDLIRSEVGAPA